MFQGQWDLKFGNYQKKLNKIISIKNDERHQEFEMPNVY